MYVVRCMCACAHTSGAGGGRWVLFHHPLPYSLERRSPTEAGGRLAASKPQQFLGILSPFLSLQGWFCLFLMRVQGFKLRPSCLCNEALLPMESSSQPFDKSLLVAVSGIKEGWQGRTRLMEITKKALKSEK